MERLFTTEELLIIQNNAQKNPQLKNPYIINIYPNNDIKDIYKISLINELILANGNSDTGFNHIHKRHEFWTRAVQLIQNEKNEKRKTQPTKFRTDNIPFFDYCEIADSVYSENRKSISGNFDVYIGNHKHKDDNIREYKLVLYLNTKIIHTLYPTKALNNIKQLDGFNFLRGNVESSENYVTSLIEVRIPYFDLDFVLKYVVVIIKDNSENKSSLSIEFINDIGHVFGHTPFEQIEYTKFKSHIHEQIFWQYADLRKIESQIKYIENKNPQKK
jgi:hypothetical protein